MNETIREKNYNRKQRETERQMGDKLRERKKRG